MQSEPKCCLRIALQGGPWYGHPCGVTSTHVREESRVTVLHDFEYSRLPQHRLVRCAYRAGAVP